MADVDEAKEQPEAEAEKGDKKSFIGRFLPWIIVGVVVVVSAGAGFGLGRLLAGPEAPPVSEVGPEADQADQTQDLSPDGGSANPDGYALCLSLWPEFKRRPGR